MTMDIDVFKLNRELISVILEYPNSLSHARVKLRPISALAL